MLSIILSRASISIYLSAMKLGHSHTSFCYHDKYIKQNMQDNSMFKEKFLE